MNLVPGRPPKREVSDETQRRIIEAARGLLRDGDAGAFSMEAVAKTAGLSRLTIYYQFGSKRALLEAIYDDIARRADLMRLPEVFHSQDGIEALRRFVEIFSHFWASDRVLVRRLRALGVLDPDFQAAVERDRWRRMGVGNILRRLAEEERIPPPTDDTVDLLCSLTSFETYDALAGEGRDTGAVTAIVEAACLRLLGLS